MSECYIAMVSCCCSLESLNAGNWEPGNPAEMFHHLRPISCDPPKKKYLQASLGLSDQKWRSGYTEGDEYFYFFLTCHSSGLIRSEEGKRLMGVPLDKDAALL